MEKQFKKGFFEMLLRFVYSFALPGCFYLTNHFYTKTIIRQQIHNAANN